MFDDMKDICNQLLLKWERCEDFFGVCFLSSDKYNRLPDFVFDPSEDFTRLTLDTIAFCSMSYR